MPKRNRRTSSIDSFLTEGEVREAVQKYREKNPNSELTSRGIALLLGLIYLAPLPPEPGQRPSRPVTGIRKVFIKRRDTGG